MFKFILDKFFDKCDGYGYYPFFRYCPKRYWNYYIKKRTEIKLGYSFNLEDPKTLNEKIRWLVFNEKLELKTRLSDKILVKDYINSKIGFGHTAETYGIYNNFKEIDFSSLPNKFALKANHAWRMNVFVKDKNFIYKNYKKIDKITSNWLKTNYEEYSVEPQYRNKKPKLFAEYLRENSERGNSFEIHCFNGIPKFIDVNHYMFVDKKYCCYTQFYDTEWNLQDFTVLEHEAINPIPKPKDLDKMLEYAKLLSQEFSYVRVDFTHDNENIHVLELTFTPFSAMIPFKNKEIDLKLGELLILPKMEK